MKKIKFTGEDGRRYSISPEEKIFCEKYIEFQGNCTEAMLAAGLGKGSRRSIAAIGGWMLSKPYISQFLKLILHNRISVSNENESEIVRKQLLFLITQNQNLGAKMKAIRLYNKLARRYPKGTRYIK